MKTLPLEVRIGFARRLREAFRRRGFWRDDEPDATKFAEAHGYSAHNVSRWLNGIIPEIPVLTSVARNLDESPGWLLFGESKNHFPLVVWLAGLLAGLSLALSPADAQESRRGTLAAEARPAVSLAGGIPLIGRWLQCLVQWITRPCLGMVLA